MYCPRCGAPNPDTTKFCRQCGLPLTQLVSYVASGGTSSLTPTNLPNLSQPVAQSLEGMSPRQKMALTIIGMIMLIPLFGMIGSLFNFGEIAGVPALLLPFGIIWAAFHFRNQARRLEQQQWQMQMQMHQMPMGLPMQQPAQPYLPEYGIRLGNPDINAPMQPPAQPYLPPAQQPVYQPTQPARPQAVLQPVQAPAYQTPLPATPQEPPNTNPLGTAPGSVVEDETKRLPDQQG